MTQQWININMNMTTGIGIGIGIGIAILIIIIIIGIYVLYLYVFNNAPRRTVTHEIDGYTVLEIYNVLTHKQCSDLIEYAKTKEMVPSTIADYANMETGSQANNTRRSTNVWLSDADHPVINNIANISAELTGLPPENQEMLQVVKYEPGGTFFPHFDVCDSPDQEFCDKFNHYSGQRRYTFLIYLNDDFTGGETEFVDIGLKIKPEIGKAILFPSVTADNQTIMPNSKHMGHEAHNGNKWICTKWSHLEKWNEIV